MLPGEKLTHDPPPAHLTAALQALREYLAGERRSLDIPLDLGAVTPFREAVYDRLLEIPYGQVATYGEIAREVSEDRGAARAVGQAVGSNPVSVVIPCHRVVAADGSLNGFGGGLRRKAALLRLEGVEVDGVRPSSKVHPEVLRLPL